MNTACQWSDFEKIDVWIFDLDNTLLAGDSDVLWGQFLVEKGIVDGDYYGAENQRFYDEYKQGTLDIHEFLAFSLKPLTEHSVETLNAMHQAFMQKHILPVMTDIGKHQIKSHKKIKKHRTTKPKRPINQNDDGTGLS